MGLVLATAALKPELSATDAAGTALREIGESSRPVFLLFFLTFPVKQRKSMAERNRSGNSSSVYFCLFLPRELHFARRWALLVVRLRSVQARYNAHWPSHARCASWPWVPTNSYRRELPWPRVALPVLVVVVVIFRLLCSSYRSPELTSSSPTNKSLSALTASRKSGYSELRRLG